MTAQHEPTDRAEPSLVADERTMLDGWLDYHRRTLLWKCEGLTDSQLKTATCPPSNLTLLGLVRHMTEVERAWFRCTLAGEDLGGVYITDDAPDAEIDDITNADVAGDMQRFRDEVDTCRRIAARATLDDVRHRERDGKDFSLRWIHTHMIEEYARHNGHADLIRQAVDGATGD